MTRLSYIDENPNTQPDGRMVVEGNLMDVLESGDARTLCVVMTTDETGDEVMTYAQAGRTTVLDLPGDVTVSVDPLLHFRLVCPEETLAAKAQGLLFTAFVADEAGNETVVPVFTDAAGGVVWEAYYADPTDGPDLDLETAIYHYQDVEDGPDVISDFELGTLGDPDDVVDLSAVFTALNAAPGVLTATESGSDLVLGINDSGAADFSVTLLDVSLTDIETAGYDQGDPTTWDFVQTEPDGG